jgi:two-component system sensor kinase FixL
MERLWAASKVTAIPRGFSRARALPYLYAIGLVGLATVTRLGLAPFLGDHVVFMFFVPAILVPSATGGFIPGLAATALAFVASRFLPNGPGDGIAGFTFACLGVAIAFGGGRFLKIQAEMNRRVLARQAQLQSILDTVPDAMIVIDERGLVQSFGPAAEKLFQWTKEEVVGKNVSLLMPWPDREAHDSYLQRYRRTGERRIIGAPRVVTARRKDGSEFQAELFIGEAISGGLSCFTGFVRDLTERRAAETRLQLLQSELVHISRLSAMGEMATALAHELNQPLSAMTNFLKGGQRLLQGENPRSRALPAMGKAAEQTLRAGEIIRRLRDFVAGGEGHREVESLRKLIQEASALGFVGARERGIVAEIQWAAAVDAVQVDKIQVQQVMLNLVRNAIEAMENSEQRELRIATGYGENDMALVSVSDTGPGINPRIADQLFQPFVTTKSGRGLGVGLSICKTIIEAHGGRIWAEPNLPTGTIFRFTLPRAEQKAAA